MRMTDAQRDKLWDLCGRHKVPFREDDYPIQTGGVFGTPAGWVEGWIGGEDGAPGIATGPEQKRNRTIYVAVEPNGDSHS